MDTKQYGRLSLGEQIYIWLFIYVLKTKFYLGQSSPEYATGCYFGLLQGLNFLVICHFIILICGIDIQDSFIYLEIGISICLILANMLFYSRRIDVIIQNHNYYPSKELNFEKSWKEFQIYNARQGGAHVEALFKAE